MKIKDIEIKEIAILGPMAGISTKAYRCFMKPFGIGLSFTEMVSDCGIDYNNKRTYEYCITDPNEHPIGLQIFGSSIEKSTEAIKILESKFDYDILDVNLGCPVHKVIKTGAGSAWLKDIDGLKEYMSAIVKTSTKPVSAKIRLGWDSNSINVFEVAKILEEAGVSLLSVHCRTREQGYGGKANYEAIKGLKESISIPLIVSGDIFTLDDAIRAKEITKADGIMIARGGVGNPYLATQINTYFESKGEIRLPNPSLEDQIVYAKKFSKMLIEEKGEYIGIRELRGILPHFFKGFKGYKKYRQMFAMEMKSIEDMKNLFNLIEEETKRKDLL